MGWLREIMVAEPINQPKLKVLRAMKEKSL